MKYLASVFLTLTLVSLVQATELKYAKNFEVTDLGSHRIVSIRNAWVGSGDFEQSYALVPKGEPLPAALPPSATVVRTPIERLVIMATVYIAPIRQLDRYEAVVAVANPEYVNDESMRRRLQQGTTVQVQSGGALDVEQLLLLKPDLILTSSTGNAVFDGHGPMARAGLPVAVTAGYMEESPLARTEWIKFVAEFFEAQAEAERIFDQVEGRYLQVAKRAQAAESRPTVIANAPYGGVWSVPGGRSYMARALRDAGADYLWADNRSRGGVPIATEAIFAKAWQADVWINPSHYDTIEALISSDPRFATLAPVQNERVFNCTLRVNENGGNDLYETGVARPDLVLSDLVKLFHPHLMPDHEFVFYEQLR